MGAAIEHRPLNEDLAKPGSSAHGIVGGQNPNGPDSAIVQAAVSFTQIFSDVAVTHAAKFVQCLKKAFVRPEKVVLNGVDDLGKETAQALAKQYGIDIADALMQNGTFGPYSVMKKFTGSKLFGRTLKKSKRRKKHTCGPK